MIILAPIKNIDMKPWHTAIGGFFSTGNSFARLATGGSQEKGTGYAPAKKFLDLRIAIAVANAVGMAKAQIRLRSGSEEAQNP
jgi:hypothetical protein